MILKIGTHPLPNRKAWIAVSKRERRSRIGRRMFYATHITCGGDLLQKDADTDALTTQMQALDAACTSDKDIVLYKSDGTTPTYHRYLTADTIDGIRLVNFQWLKGSPEVGGARGSGTQYHVRRSWMAEFYGEFLNNESNIIEWQERLSIIGDGGPVFISKCAQTGPVQFQQTQLFSPILIVQTGSGVGMLSRPLPPDPIAPLSVHHEKTRIEPFTPRFGVHRNTGFGIRWTFFMESAAFGSVGPTLLP